MLERSDLHAPELTAALTRRFIGSPSSPFPQRGGHQSALRGASPEFSEHTEYTPGDDVRSLDWKVYAKTDRYYVKRREDERLSRAMIVVDGSNSMAYGAPEGELKGSKYHLAARVAVSLANALLRQGDAVGLVLSGPAPFTLAPRPGMKQLDAVIEVVAGAEVGGDAPVSRAVADAVQRLSRRGALYLVSDLLREGDETLDFLAGCAQREIAARVIHLLHSDEVELPFDRVAKFVDLETGSELSIDPDSVRKAYREEMRGFVAGVRRRGAELGAGVALVRDEAECVRKLPALLAGGGYG